MISRFCRLYWATAIQGAHVSTCSSVSGHPQSAGVSQPEPAQDAESKPPCCLKTIKADLVGEVAFPMQFQGPGVFLSCGSPFSRSQAPSAGNCISPAGGRRSGRTPGLEPHPSPGPQGTLEESGHTGLRPGQHPALRGKLPFSFSRVEPMWPYKMETRKGNSHRSLYSERN